MQNRKKNKAFLALLIVFMIVNGFCTAFAKWLQSKGIDPAILGVANVILFIMSLVIYFMHKKALQKSNPNAFVRSVMAGTFLKLMVIAGAIVVYFLIAGKNKSLYTVVAAIGLYFIYTIIEVRSAQNLNREHGKR